MPFCLGKKKTTHIFRSNIENLNNLVNHIYNSAAIDILLRIIALDESDTNIIPVSFPFPFPFPFFTSSAHSFPFLTLLLPPLFPSHCLLPPFLLSFLTSPTSLLFPLPSLFFTASVPSPFAPSCLHVVLDSLFPIRIPYPFFLLFFSPPTLLVEVVSSPPFSSFRSLPPRGSKHHRVELAGSVPFLILLFFL